MSLLTVDGLTVRYGAEAVVDNLSFSIKRGESVGLVGESGSGKTQTALSLLGLLPASATTRGSIRLGNDTLCDDGVFATERELDRLRARRIALVFQDPALALNPCVRVGRQLEQIVIRHGLASRAAAAGRVLEALARVGLPDPKRQARAYAHQLSGGMRQRAMIAAALVAEPELLVADEPTTALDVTVQAQVLELLAEIRTETALLLITHDLGVVSGHTERLLVLENGCLVEQGETQAVFERPGHAHTRALLDARPDLERPPQTKPASAPALFEVSAIDVSYREPGRRRLKAVNGVDFDVKPYETVAIVGESGSGKSTLVRAALGLVPPDAGRVVFAGNELARSVGRRPARVCSELAMVFQDPVGSLNPQLSVGRIVAEPLLKHSLAADTVRERVAALLERVGLEPGFATRYPHELSGGQAQRVAIARALIDEPRVLVLDEAVAALDGTVRRQVLELLRAEQARTGLAILFIAHDLAVVREIAHRVLVMYLGRLVEVADNEVLFETPAHPYTRALLAAIPEIRATGARTRAVPRGEAPSILSPPSGCAFHPRCGYAEPECRAAVPVLEPVGMSVAACRRARELQRRQG